MYCTFLKSARSEEYRLKTVMNEKFGIWNNCWCTTLQVWKQNTGFNISTCVHLIENTTENIQFPENPFNFVCLLNSVLFQLFILLVWIFHYYNCFSVNIYDKICFYSNWVEITMQNNASRFKYLINVFHICTNRRVRFLFNVFPDIMYCPVHFSTETDNSVL